MEIKENIMNEVNAKNNGSYCFILDYSFILIIVAIISSIKQIHKPYTTSKHQIYLITTNISCFSKCNPSWKM